MTCLEQPANALVRRRLFWSTQPDNGCASVDSCGVSCGQPGLEFVNLEPIPNDPDVRPRRTISTDEWVRGLAINMLMTDGRRNNTVCGHRPGALGGHWSESFDRSQTPQIGSLVLQTDSAATVEQTLNLTIAFAQATLDRLVTRGVAVRVDVEGEYLGSNRFQIMADIIGLGNNSARVGITGERLKQGWVWQ